MNSSSTTQLLDRSIRGHTASLGELLERHQDRLLRMVRLRIDRRLQGRIDAADVVQEAFLEASRRLSEYDQESMPFFLWLRLITGQRLMALHRRHLGAEMRDAGREVSLYQGMLPETTSAGLAAQLMGHQTKPSEAAMRTERRVRVEEALNRMDPIDREVLALRHFEQLSATETSDVLGIKEAAARKRYIRALARLKDILAAMPGGVEELLP